VKIQMPKLSRQVRFSINPFLEKNTHGANAYASKPAGEGLALYFALWVELTGQIDPQTGLVVNVVDIDRPVRDCVVPAFAEQIKKNFKQGRHFSFTQIAALLKKAWAELKDKFTPAQLSMLTLELNPYRKLAIDSEDCLVIYFSEKFEFAATHKLWNEKFSAERNFELFGKCANPGGHGHNYIVEVTITQDSRGEHFGIGKFEKIVDEQFIQLVDHKNLNAELPEFSQTNPTVENIAAFAWQKLAGRFEEAKLHCVTVWETDRTFASCLGKT